MMKFIVILPIGKLGYITLFFAANLQFKPVERCLCILSFIRFIRFSKTIIAVNQSTLIFLTWDNLVNCNNIITKYRKMTLSRTTRLDCIYNSDQLSFSFDKANQINLNKRPKRA